MTPEWSEVVVVKAVNRDQPEVHSGACGRVYIDGHEVKHVRCCVLEGVIGEEDVPCIKLEIEPRSIRIILESDLEEDDMGVLNYNRPRKLIIRRRG